MLLEYRNFFSKELELNICFKIYIHSFCFICFLCVYQSSLIPYGTLKILSVAVLICKMATDPSTSRKSSFKIPGKWNILSFGTLEARVCGMRCWIHAVFFGRDFCDSRCVYMGEGGYGVPEWGKLHLLTIESIKYQIFLVG